nr:hypothetical protein JVH1_8452 [Rhodococcus sp. JVH1]
MNDDSTVTDQRVSDEAWRSARQVRRTLSTWRWMARDHERGVALTDAGAASTRTRQGRARSVSTPS